MEWLKTGKNQSLVKFLSDALVQEEDFDIASIMEKFLNSLQEQFGAEKAFIANNNQDRIYHSAKTNSDDIKFSGNNLQKFPIENWGHLYLVKATKTESEKFWEDLGATIALFLHSAELKIKTRLISDLNSEIRRTLRPDLALEKVYNSFKDYAQIQGFYFFRKIISTNEEDQDLFKGYSLFFEAPQNSLNNFDKDRIYQLEDIKEINLLETEIFQSKVRGREWGLLVVSRNEKWTPELIEIFELFTEQMGTVFNQHELHSESLSMAQREFLLNRITTKIRESLAADNIIETAVQEIGQVMGVESCGILILNRKVRGSFGHKVWSIEESYSQKMIDTIYASLKTELEPNWLEPSKKASDCGLKSYLHCGLFKDGSKELIGILAVGFIDQMRSWTADEQLLLEGVAKQLEIALVQASIYQESQQTKRQMALLHRLSSDIRDSLDISIVLGQIAKGIGEVLGLNRCFVRRFSSESQVFKTEEEYCSTGFNPSADLIFDFEKEWMAQLAHRSNEKSLDILNIPSVEIKLADENPDLFKIAQAIKLKSYLSIPLVARGRILGSIIVHQCDRERNFLPEEIEFIFRVGSEAAIAIEHAELFETINRFNKTDPDTGLYNKKYFKEIADQEIKKSQEESKNISFMLVDVDYLKDINDTPECGGHEAGDEAIRILANILANTVRQTPVDEVHKRIADIVGRFGGDEFMILLPNTHIDDAIKVAHRIAANLAKAKHSTWPKALTCSIGIAGTPQNPYDYQQLKTLADKALYLSKHKGRNAISSTLELQQDLR